MMLVIKSVCFVSTQINHNSVCAAARISNVNDRRFYNRRCYSYVIFATGVGPYSQLRPETDGGRHRKRAGDCAETPALALVFLKPRPDVAWFLGGIDRRYEGTPFGRERMVGYPFGACM